MFNVSEKSTIYVACPGFNKTGGTELAHQLVYELNQNKIEAYITYYGHQNLSINPAFTNYVTSFKILKDVRDTQDNIIIVPEIRQDILHKFIHIQKSVWWMSVDNYLKNNGVINFYSQSGLLRTLKYILNGQVKIGGRLVDKNVTHLYQSEYAHNFLVSKGINDAKPLSDYLNPIYFDSNKDNFSNRESIVLYNPKKGFDYTQKLISNSQNLQWIPIQDMTTTEVHKLLRKSKVYIDFGNHPGKDRFPREAAISGCCVITGRQGSANFYQDIPISDEYKYDSSVENVPIVIDKITECLNEYEIKKDDFEVYRSFIRNEYNQFQTDVKKLFCK